MAGPLVSVLLPVRNARGTLAECLDSIAAQTLPEHEVLAVDDHSRDGSGDLLRARARGDRRLRVLPNPGRGLVSGLNHGLARARASLVARMDADDRMHRERLALQHPYPIFLAQPHVSLCD